MAALDAAWPSTASGALPARSGSTAEPGGTVAGVIAALSDAPLPPLSGRQLLSTQFDFVPVALIVAALVLYLWGVRRNNALHPRHPWSAGKTAAWIGALVTTGISIFTFIGVYDTELFWDHMVQHLLLIMVAAPLFAIASPLELAWRATTGTSHIAVTEVLRSRPAKFLGHPIVAFVLYAVMIPVSHLTSWYNLTLQHESVHNAEHLAFLVVGYLFWRQIFGGDPNCYRLHPALQFFYLFLAIPIDTFTGLSLDRRDARAVPRLPRHPPDLGSVLRRRPPHRRRHHVGRRRHLDAVAHDPGRAALDAHGRAQGRAHRPRTRRPVGSAEGDRPDRSAPRGPSARPAPRRGRCSRRTRSGGAAEVDRGPARFDHGAARAPRPGPPTAATSRTRNDRWVRPSWLTARRSPSPNGGRAR